MPCTKEFEVDTSKPVLVTGATGYIAGVLCSQLLERGLTVHATVRDPSNTEKLKYLQAAADESKGSIKYFKADLMEDGSFGEAMEGCSIVFHTASPFVTKGVKDPQKELVDPAILGTTNVLEQANKTASVTRVVLTSSCAAIHTDASESSEEKPFTEEIWNETATLDHMPYYLSKTLAEKKAWEIADAQSQWKLVTINPAIVFGPGLTYHEGSASYKLIRDLGTKSPKTRNGCVDLPFGIVDVKDVASAHIAVAYLKDAEGRHILCNESLSMPEMGQAIAEKYGEEYPIVTTAAPTHVKYIIWFISAFVNLGISRKFVDNNWGRKTYFDNTKSKEALGMEYYPVQKSLQEMYQQLIDYDAVTKKSKGWF